MCPRSSCEGCSNRQGILSDDLGGMGRGLAEKPVDCVSKAHFYTMFFSWQKPGLAAVTLAVICNTFPLGESLCTCAATSCYVACGILN